MEMSCVLCYNYLLNHFNVWNCPSAVKVGARDAKSRRVNTKLISRSQSPVGPRWAPCWPHESCYQGSHLAKDGAMMTHCFFSDEIVNAISKPF